MSGCSNNSSGGVDPEQVGQEQCEETRTTYCDLDIENNVWVEGVVDIPAGKRGICMLDTMSASQVIHVLQHDPRARRDLSRVTSSPDLLALLDRVSLLPTGNPADDAQRQDARRGLPFYTQFAGRPPVPRDKKVK